MSSFRQERVALEPSQAVAAVDSWFDTILGQAVMSAEAELLSKLLPGVFGYRLVQLGISPRQRLYESSDAGHRFIVSPATDTDSLNMEQGYLCSEPGQLALASESADILLLHHVLDFDLEPHAVLREAVRVLISGGTAIVVGFNPWSLFALRQSLRPENLPWSASFLSPGRLRDWMNLLDLQAQGASFAFYRPPVSHAGLLARLGWMEKLGHRLHLPVGGFYVMMARKQPVGMTPLRPRARRRGLLVPGLNPTLGETRNGPDRRNLS